MEQIRSKRISDIGEFFHGVGGLAIAALVMLGVGGTVYNLVAPDGWLVRAFDRSIAGGMAAVLALMLIAVSAWMTRSWVSISSRNRHPELFVYGFAAVGAVYAIQFLIKGAS